MLDSVHYLNFLMKQKFYIFNTRIEHYKTTELRFEFNSMKNVSK